MMTIVRYKLPWAAGVTPVGSKLIRMHSCAVLLCCDLDLADQPGVVALVETLQPIVGRQVSAIAIGQPAPIGIFVGHWSDSHYGTEFYLFDQGERGPQT